MSSSNCCFLTCIQISQEAGQVVWYFHLLKNFPQSVVIHIVKGFGVVNKAEVDVFLEPSCLFYDPMDIGNLASGSLLFLNPAWTILYNERIFHYVSFSCRETSQMFISSSKEPDLSAAIHVSHALATVPCLQVPMTSLLFLVIKNTKCPVINVVTNRTHVRENIYFVLPSILCWWISKITKTSEPENYMGNK